MWRYTAGLTESSVVLLLLCCGCNSSGRQLQQELEQQLKTEGLAIAVAPHGAGYVRLYGFDGRLIRGFGLRTFPLVCIASSGRMLVAEGENAVFGLSLAGDIVWEERRRRGQDRLGCGNIVLSPDGQLLAYRLERRAPADWAVSQPKGGPPVAQYRIGEVAGPAGETIIAEGSNDNSEMMGWSPDSGELVYSLEGQVRIYNRRSRTHRVVTRGLNPTWSPDGHWIAYQPAKGSAALHELETGRRLEVLPDEEILYGMQWSPDSQYLMLGWKQRHVWGDQVVGIFRPIDAAKLTVLKFYDAGSNRDMGWVFLPAEVQQTLPR